MNWKLRFQFSEFSEFRGSAVTDRDLLRKPPQNSYHM